MQSDFLCFSKQGKVLEAKLIYMKYPSVIQSSLRFLNDDERNKAERRTKKFDSNVALGFYRFLVVLAIFTIYKLQFIIVKKR